MLMGLFLPWYLKTQLNVGKRDNDTIYCYVFKRQTIKNQIKVELVGDNFTELRGEIAGPPDTPYEGILLSVSHLNYDDSAQYQWPECIHFILSKVADIILK